MGGRIADEGPVARFDRETTDPELGHDWLRQAYRSRVLRSSGNRAAFRMRMASAGIDGFRVDEVRHSMSVEARVDPLDAVVVVRPRAGRFWVAGHGDEVAQGPGGLLLLDSAHEFRAGWSPSIAMQVVRIEADPARRVVADVTGRPASQAGFYLSTVSDERHVRYWLAVVAQVQQILDSDEVASLPLVRADAIRMLTTAVLVTFRATPAAGGPRCPGG